MTNVVVGGTATGATALPTANTIDAAADLLLIYTASATATQAISRNTLLGITGAPLGTTDSQSVSNKTLGITNAYTALDGSFTLKNTADPTKIGVLSLAGVTTGTTRTYTLPNASVTLASLTGTESLTNKTLTSPTITGGTLDNTTVTVDSIAGHTTANTGTIYGVSISAGTFSGSTLTAGSIGTTALATNAVQGNQIATNAITLASISSSTTQSGISTTDVIVTGLSTTVTIPAGGRKVRVEAYIPRMNITAIANPTISIYNSTTVTGTAIQIVSQLMAIANNGLTMYAVIEYTPSPGSQSYCVALRTDAGSGSTAIGATTPALLTVKLV